MDLEGKEMRRRRAFTLAESLVSVSPSLCVADCLPILTHLFVYRRPCQWQPPFKAQLRQSNRRRSRFASRPSNNDWEISHTIFFILAGSPSSQPRSPRPRIVIIVIRLWLTTLTTNDALVFYEADMPAAQFVALPIDRTHLGTLHTSPSCCFRLRSNTTDEGAGDSKVTAVNCRRWSQSTQKDCKQSRRG